MAGVRYVLCHVLDTEDRARAIKDSASGPKATTARLQAIRDTAALYRRPAKAPASPAMEEAQALTAEALTAQLRANGEVM